MSLAPGARLGPYEIVAAIGAGGMGEVYKARDTRLDRRVAIKVLPPEFAADPERLRRFEQEARAVAALDQPNILVIHDVGTHEGAPYLVTELLEGESLRDQLRSGARPVRRAVEVAVQIAQGLAAAHEKGIVHRDLKPGNVFLTKDGRVKILDFGIAKLVARKTAEELPRATTVVEATAAGATLGTVGYMSPEQVRGQAVDQRSDIFCLGVVLYEMLAGRRPFAATTEADTCAAILSSDPRPLTEHGVEIPQGLQAIVLRCLEKRPEDRFTSARDVAFALLALAQSSEAPDRAPHPRNTVRDDRPSLAVLPFVNLSADAGQEYFCDGMAEEIINALAHVNALRVVARTSSFAFKGHAEDVREIGTRLDVAALLEGSVRKAGDRLRITAQLVDVANGSHLWSDRYDRGLEDVFAIQEEIALAIVKSLKVHLLGQERAAIERRATENLDAHSAYLRGQFYWNAFTPDAFVRSRAHYEEAITIDPDYAPALGGLGMWYVSQAFWADFPSEQAWQEGSAAAQRALSSAPEYWLGHTVRGNLLAFFERRWAEAEESLRKGVQYGPSQAHAHFNLAAFLTIRRRWGEMAEEARLALRLDPLSAPNCAWNAVWLNRGGHVDEATAELQKILAIEPNHWLPHWGLAMLAAGGARLDEARTEFEKAVALSGRASIALTHLACICQALGDEHRVRELEAELQERARRGYVAPTQFAWIAGARRGGEEAVHWLERAAATHDPLLCFYRMMPPPLFSGHPAIEAALQRLDV